MLCILKFPTPLTEHEESLIAHGVMQIAALVAAKVTGRGLIINPGESALSWDFLLMDSSDEEEQTFAERLGRFIRGYVLSTFPDADVQLLASPRPVIATS